MPGELSLECSKCSRTVHAWLLLTCPMCSRTVCVKCAHFEYGRYFCGPGCAVYFFYGDSEGEEVEEP